MQDQSQAAGRFHHEIDSTRYKSCRKTHALKDVNSRQKLGFYRYNPIVPMMTNASHTRAMKTFVLQMRPNMSIVEFNESSDLLKRSEL